MDIENLYQDLQKNRFLIAGPCVIENENMVMEIADEVKKISDKYGFTYIFKASFDKANRTSLHSFRGPEIEKGLSSAQTNLCGHHKLNLPIYTKELLLHTSCIHAHQINSSQF